MTGICRGDEAGFIMPAKLMDYFNKQPRTGLLSTASRDGKVDAAVFGSPMMLDEKTAVMGLGENRTLEYLQENPNAVFVIVEQGKPIMDRKGLRVYLKMKEYPTSGKMLECLQERDRPDRGRGGCSDGPRPGDVRGRRGAASHRYGPGLGAFHLTREPAWPTPVTSGRGRPP